MLRLQQCVLNAQQIHIHVSVFNSKKQRAGHHLVLLEQQDSKALQALRSVILFVEMESRLAANREKTEMQSMEMDAVQHAQLKLVIHDLEAQFLMLIYALRFEETAGGQLQKLETIKIL